MKSKGKLKRQERDDIARLLNRGYSLHKIAIKIGRSVSTVSDEIKRHKRWDGLEGKFIYEAIFAQDKSEDAHNKSKKITRMDDLWIYAYVTESLRSGWSPEQIEGRIKKDYAGDKSKHIGHSSIYEWIYDKDQKSDKWWEYLRRKQKKRKKHHAVWVHKSRIPRRVSLSKRPKYVDKRKAFGHWEGDTVEGQRSVGDGFHTEIERLSRFTQAVLITKIDSEQTIKAQKQIFETLPPHARLSDTLDNGRENHKHYELTDDLGMRTYFCHPYASYERGTNENTNGLLREYIPKKTNLKTITQEELDEIVEELNNRPRKCLNYQTPLEVFTKHCTIPEVFGSES